MEEFCVRACRLKSQHASVFVLCVAKVRLVRGSCVAKIWLVHDNYCELNYSDFDAKVVPCVNQLRIKTLTYSLQHRRPTCTVTHITCWRMASVNDSNWSILALAGSEQVTTLLASSSAKSYSIFKQLVTIGNFPLEYQLLNLY